MTFDLSNYKAKTETPMWRQVHCFDNERDPYKGYTAQQLKQLRLENQRKEWDAQIFDMAIKIADLQHREAVLRNKIQAARARLRLDKSLMDLKEMPTIPDPKTTQKMATDSKDTKALLPLHVHVPGAGPLPDVAKPLSSPQASPPNPISQSKARRARRKRVQTQLVH